MAEASQLAYAAVSYVRHEYEDGEITVRFIAAKAKVAPTKVTSIPRLELMAAVLGLRLSRKDAELLQIPFENCTLWTDSEDVICWIQGQSRSYKTSVAKSINQRSIRSRTHDSGAMSQLNGTVQMQDEVYTREN